MTNFLIDYKSIEDDIILIDSRSMLDPPLPDIDFQNKIAWVWSPDSGLPLKIWSRYVPQISFIGLILGRDNYFESMTGRYGRRRRDLAEDQGPLNRISQFAQYELFALFAVRNIRSIWTVCPMWNVYTIKGGSYIKVSHLVIGLHTLEWPTFTF